LKIKRVKMNDNELTALSNDLLFCYWNKASVDEMAKITARYGVSIGSKIFERATERAEIMISGSDAGWDLLSPENKTRMFQESIQLICNETGAQLGKDISVVDGGVLLADKFIQPFLDSLSPDQLAEFKAKDYIRSQHQDPFKMLEDSLGVPFFTKLEAIVKLRIQALDDVRSAVYLSGLTGGMQNKHFWLSDDWIVGFIKKVCGGRFNRIAKANLLSDNGETGALIFDDLLMALGVEERHEHPDCGRVISRTDLLALDKIFRGTQRSCAEMAEMMRRFEEKNK
jgi:hypothetical protein